ncbi:hypothetical protein BDA96_06G159100 [Sorghum bicolor]|uniref:Uncharacterized protein n=1 Tax=Sorghum bicolor TaxID=4558 RepID=A0A921UD85_SORBI|nr:hypothetical protein BDA96_06G159100 [Sorghum bicolor]
MLTFNRVFEKKSIRDFQRRAMAVRFVVGRKKEDARFASDGADSEAQSSRLAMA